MIRILHVDDVQSDNEIVSYNLHRIDSSLEIVWVPSGQSALKLISNEDFDCIISDFQLPKMNGMEFLVRLRESGDDTPLVFLTGQGNEKLAAEAFRNGADEYYTKDEGFAHYTRLLNSIRKIVKAREERRGRLEAMAATRQNEQLYHTIFENAGDAMFIVNFHGNCIEINSKACEFLGLTREEIIGLTPADFDAPEYVDNVENRFEEIISHGQAVFETAWKHKNGSIINIEVNARVIDYLGEKAILSIARNITERKRTEQELLVKTRALETSVYGVAFADIKGNLTYANRALLDIWGYDNFEEICGHSIFEYWQQKFTKKRMSEIFETLQEKGHWSNIAPALRKDGSIFHVRFTSELVRNKDGKPICIMGTFADITDQVEAENELQLKNYVIESSNTAIAIAETNGTISYVNPALLKMCGYENSPENLIGHTTRRFFSSPKDVVPMYRGLRKNGTWQGELMARRSDGSLYPVLASGSAVTNDAGEQICWMCTFQDLSSQKKQEDKRKESELRLRYILDNAACGIGLVDKQGMFIEVNDTFGQMLGYTKEELMKLSFADITHPEDRNATVRHFAKSSSGESEGYRVEKRYLCKDGSSLWVDVAVKIIRGEDHEMLGGVGIVIDISHQVEMREELQANEQKFRSIFENSRELMFMVDTETLEIIDGSKAAFDFYGYTQDEFCSLRLTDILTEDTRKIIENLEDFDKEAVGRFESTHQLADGTVREMGVSISPLTLPSNKRVHFVMALDITEQNRINRELEKSRDTLEEKTKALETVNSELKSFSYSVSHDLRAPLRYIVGFSNLLKEHLESKEEDKEAAEYLDRIMSSCNRMNELIEGLLKLSRVSSEELKYEDVDISAMALEIGDELRRSDPDRKLDLTIQEGLNTYADRQLLSTALTNLLSNAWKFTKGKKKTQIEVGFIDSEVGERAIYIKDNGAGFHPEEADKLFTPFQRLHTQDEFTGSGIGLATVKRILSRHGGNIWAEGAEGEGATFYFSLPIFLIHDQ